MRNPDISNQVDCKESLETLDNIKNSTHCCIFALRLVQFGQLVEALFLAKSISISVYCGGSAPCCMDADVTSKIVMYHFACFTAQVVTFTYANGQRPTINPRSLPAKNIVSQSLRACR